jgi:hypothetical protein
MKTEQQYLLWRYLWTATLIAVSVGMAAVAAHWTALIG